MKNLSATDVNKIQFENLFVSTHCFQTWGEKTKMWYILFKMLKYII